MHGFGVVVYNSKQGLLRLIFEVYQRSQINMTLTKEDLQSIGNLMDDKIGELARVVADGFDEVNRKFDNLQKSMDEQFASVRLDISRIKNAIEELEEGLKKERKYTIEDVDALSDQVIKMENDIKLVKNEIKKLKFKAA